MWKSAASEESALLVPILSASRRDDASPARGPRRHPTNAPLWGCDCDLRTRLNLLSEDAGDVVSGDSLAGIRGIFSRSGCIEAICTFVMISIKHTVLRSKSPGLAGAGDAARGEMEASDGTAPASRKSNPCLNCEWSTNAHE